MAVRSGVFDFENPRASLLAGTKGGGGVRSPYNGPLSDDSDDDGASDYANYNPRRGTATTTATPVAAASDNLLQRFYETVDAPCQAVACQGGIEDQLDLLTVRRYAYYTIYVCLHFASLSLLSNYL